METDCCNPYGGFDTQASSNPHFLTVEMPKGMPAMLRVVSLEDKSPARLMALLAKKKQLKLPDGVTLNWTLGQTSALDVPEITKGRDVGNITTTKFGADVPIDGPYSVDSAFAYDVFPRTGRYTSNNSDQERGVRY